jgi:plastocyanin
MALAVRSSRTMFLAATVIGFACGGGGGGPGPTPTQIAKAPTNDGDGQVGPAGQALATPLAVIVRDASNNPVAGVAVAWATGAGSGSITSPSSSDANGIATATWTLGPNAGTQTATATKTGLAGSPVSFTATAQIQGATQMAKNAGDNQVGPAGQALGTQISVITKDQNGTAVAGVTVSWAAANGGSVSPPQTNSDVSGIASTTWTLGPNAGTQTATATKTGLTGSPVGFSAVSQVQGATQLAMTSLNAGNGQTDTVLATLANPYRVIATDQNGTPVQSVTVNWAVTAGGGSVSATSSVTDATGIAVITHTLGATAGSQSVHATVTGLIGSPVTFTSTANPGVATVIAKNGGDNQTGAINTALSTAQSVIVHDSHGNVVSQVPVTWVVGDGGGSVNPTSTTTGTNGVASTIRTLGPTVGAQTDTAKSTGLSGSPLVFQATAVTAPSTATVSVGDIFFKSDHNASQNPAVDTIAVGGKVTWNWVGTASHSVQSTGTPSFTSSAIKTGVGQTYSFTFTTAGTYTYDCAVHGTLMTGRVVVE